MVLTGGFLSFILKIFFSFPFLQTILFVRTLTIFSHTIHIRFLKTGMAFCLRKRLSMWNWVFIEHIKFLPHLDISCLNAILSFSKSYLASPTCINFIRYCKSDTLSSCLQVFSMLWNTYRPTHQHYTKKTYLHPKKTATSSMQRPAFLLSEMELCTVFWMPLFSTPPWSKPLYLRAVRWAC